MLKLFINLIQKWKLLEFPVVILKGLAESYTDFTHSATIENSIKIKNKRTHHIHKRVITILQIQIIITILHLIFYLFLLYISVMFTVTN
jgi:hypothetical protein